MTHQGVRLWLAWVAASTLPLVLPLAALEVADQRWQLHPLRLEDGRGVTFILGLLMAFLVQYFVLRPRFAYAGAWAPATLGGIVLWIACFYLVSLIPIYSWTRGSLPSNLPEELMLRAFGASIGIIQTLVLRKTVRCGGWWVLFSTIGWAIPFSLPRELLWQLPFSAVSFVGLFGLLNGGLTGALLVWLLHVRRHPGPEQSRLPFREDSIVIPYLIFLAFLVLSVVGTMIGLINDA